MKKTFPSLAGALIPFAMAGGLAAPAHADQFIGFGQAGTPGTWAFESFPVVNRSAKGSTSVSANTVLAYFSETGFTGTKRDQLEVWFGLVPGYTSPVAGGGRKYGVTSPNVGLEYYYNVIEPKAPYGSPDYVTFWTSPTLMIELPNGNKDASGFAAGGNRYAYSLSLSNYLQVGKWAASFTPVGLYYTARSRTATDMGSGDIRYLRGGLSVTLADVAAGYQVTPALWLGIHHSYNIYNRSSSDFAESREGKIGPSMTYTGWSRYGLYVSANLNFGYYHSKNLPHANSLTMAVVKTF